SAGPAELWFGRVERLIAAAKRRRTVPILRSVSVIADAAIVFVPVIHIAGCRRGQSLTSKAASPTRKQRTAAKKVITGVVSAGHSGLRAGQANQAAVHPD